MSVSKTKLRNDTTEAIRVAKTPRDRKNNHEREYSIPIRNLNTGLRDESILLIPNTNLPVFVFSKLAGESDIKKAKSLGAREYFTKKEITIKSIIDKVKSL